MCDTISFSVPSCSGSGIRKRRNNSDSDSSVSGIKIPRGNFYFVLESESDIPSSDYEDTESIISLQNKSTDFARDTSDTASKTSHYGSDFEVEFEVVSLSENEVKLPFDDTSSVGTDLDTSKKGPFDGSDESDRSEWADSSSGPEAASNRYTIPARLRSCLKCKAPTCVHYCQRCYKVRKDFFPQRPSRLNKRRKITRPLFRKKCNSKEEPAKETPKDEKFESGIESCSSQELTPDENPDSTVQTEGLCNVCFKNPKDGAFIHCRWVHIYSCYECSIKIWFSSRCCPLCNGKVNKVLKVATG